MNNEAFFGWDEENDFQKLKHENHLNLEANQRYFQSRKPKERIEFGVYKFFDGHPASRGGFQQKRKKINLTWP